MGKRTLKILFLVLVLFAIICNNIKVNGTERLDVDAKAVFVLEKSTGKIMYEKNAYEQNYPASTTKILTAIIVIENCNLDDVATVSNAAISNIPTSYVITPLFVDEQIKIEDLLYALMLKSANDAAYVLAEYVGGSIDNFSNMMNKKAEEIGCKNSHFVNPNGIHNDNHYTTAYDMYLISSYAMKNKTFVDIVSTYKYILPETNRYENTDRIMENTNEFIDPNSAYFNENIRGIKTGTTDQAGECLITNIIKDKMEYFIVVLGAETKDSRFKETKKIINYLFENYAYTTIYKKGDVVKTIEIENATDETKNLNLIISDDITVFNSVKTKKDEIEPEIVLMDKIRAPISEGQKIGTIKYNIEDLQYSAILTAEKDVNSKLDIKQIAIVCGAGFIIFTVLIIIKRKNKRRKRSR